MKTDDILQIPTDMLLSEELAGEDVGEMASLTATHLDFWYHAGAWTHPEVNDLMQKLNRV